mmetsp:Transcript_52456/g.125333  ORF Transcript_52456/g.125333 Transcript_52456/m.125333 type:complete len:509 (+) Transcript_52456:68-1594(+)|eukprot:CAMPEP_0178407268 /NCGR_PEP_ID=MMETSP0689_2-20121128/19342_1 /TAXON_ID=160604 /ORGANISM="Amphidinium massartii, Strain CS-259" /LENGTH=508 /DNA_ID=CAMNT_0020028339 /DNA_START=62 /DNA_END=1588 /DNA_ORIENTATION=-
MSAKRDATEAGLSVGNPHDPKACKARRGVSPNFVVKDASDALAAFCKATGAVSFFTCEEPESKRLMHAAVVTPSNGYIFFEDIAVNAFAATMAVPFSEYRADNKEHVSLHANVPDAVAIEKKMLLSGGTSVVPVAKQFWGAVHGCVKDPCGILWSLSTKADADAEVGPQPPSVRSGICVRDVGEYLTFLKDAFGELLVEQEVCSDSNGIVHAELLLSGSGLSLDRMSEGDSAAAATLAAGLKAYTCISMQVPTGRGKSVAAALVDLGATVISEVQLKFYGQVQGRVRMPSGIYVSINEPPIENGPTKADINAYIQIGEKHGWDMVCTLKALPFKRYVGIRSQEKAKMKDLQDADFFPKAFKAVPNSLGKDALAGPPVAIYHHADPDQMIFTVTAGFPVKDDFDLEGSGCSLDTEAGKLQQGEVEEKLSTCASTKLHGTFDKLPKAWGALMAWYKARGCDFDCDSSFCGVELYWDNGGGCDHASKGEAPPLTEIFCPAPVVKDPAPDSA